MLSKPHNIMLLVCMDRKATSLQDCLKVFYMMHGLVLRGHAACCMYTSIQAFISCVTINYKIS